MKEFAFYKRAWGICELAFVTVKFLTQNLIKQIIKTLD